MIEKEVLEKIDIFVAIIFFLLLKMFLNDFGIYFVSLCISIYFN